MLERIRAALPALPPAEQRVAALALADPRAFISLAVGELARRSQVSKPTVVRFCRSIGYDGLTDFKHKLAGSVSADIPLGHRPVGEGDNSADVVVKVIDNSVCALLRFRNAIADQAFERAITALADAGARSRRIDFYGVGNCGIVAQDAQHKFFRLGVRATAVSDGHVQVMSASMLAPGDCAVAIGNSGRSGDLLDAADIALRCGATLIAITASGSPLARLAQSAGQVVLAADPPEDDDHYSPMVARLLHLVVIDILTTAVALRLAGERRPMLQQIERNLKARRYAQAG